MRRFRMNFTATFLAVIFYTGLTISDAYGSCHVFTGELCSAMALLDSPSDREQDTPKKESRKERKAAEKKATEKRVRGLLKGGDFLFVAERMTGTRPAVSRMLSGGYGVLVTEDKIECELPFIGRMTSAPYNAGSSNPFSFTSTKFTYTEEETDESVKYYYEISPEGLHNPMKFYFEIWYSTGRVSLSIVQTRGDSAYYTGYIQDIEQWQE